MMRARLRKLLQEAMNKVGIYDGNIRIVLYPIKRKIASVSLKTKSIRLNKYIIQNLDDDIIIFILVHELIHIKLGSTTHDTRFWQEITRLYPDEKITEIEARLIYAASFKPF